MTWLAVVFDFVYKIKHLGLNGEEQAETLATAFFKAQTDQNFTFSQQFENTLLEKAISPYGFITGDE
jgi:hypothetical protein